MGTLSSRTRAMKLTPRDLASASTLLLLLLLASAASAQHATESLTSEVRELTIVTILLTTVLL